MHGIKRCLFCYRNHLYNGRFDSNGDPLPILGLAWYDAACKAKERTSINREFGQYGSIATGAHELGHKYAITTTIIVIVVVHCNQ